jgi:hypothetical protein
MKKWLEAFYSPCKVKILNRIYDDCLSEGGVNTQKNGYGETQYNAVGALKRVIGPIQKSYPDAIGLISFTDFD